MKWERRLGAALAGILMLATPAKASINQDPFRNPVARFSPSKPLRIVVLNKTGLPLEYALTDPRQDIQELQAGQTVEIKNFRIPNCLGINTPMLSPVRYILTQKSNVLTVEVKTVNDLSGDHCLQMDKTGAIFVY